MTTTCLFIDQNFDYNFKIFISYFSKKKRCFIYICKRARFCAVMPERLRFVSLSSAPEEDVLKGKQSIRSSVMGNQNSESELLLEDDDTLSSLDDKELENLTGEVANTSSTSVRLQCNVPNWKVVESCRGYMSVLDMYC